MLTNYVDKFWSFFDHLSTPPSNGNFFLIKGLIIVGPGLIALAPFWVPDDIESCNFQNLLVFGFSETSQNLMSFRKLLFSLFHGGDQREKSENPKKCQISGIHI